MRCLLIFVASTLGCVLTADSSALAQSTGTFSANAVQGLGMGTDTPSKKVVQPIVTETTIDAWLKANAKKAKSRRLQAAERGIIVKTAKQGAEWNEKTNRYRFSSRDEKSREVNRLRSEILAAAMPRLDPFSLKVGQIGMLCYLPGSTVRRQLPYCVLQILNKDTAIVAARSSFYAEFFIVGDLVGEFQEDQQFSENPTVFLVEKRKTFSTSFGAPRTLPVLRQFDLLGRLEKVMGDDDR